MKNKTTAKQFLESKESELFKKYCAQAGIEPTKRQVRKYRAGRGLAQKRKQIAISVLS